MIVMKPEPLERPTEKVSLYYLKGTTEADLAALATFTSECIIAECYSDDDSDDLLPNATAYGYTHWVWCETIPTFMEAAFARGVAVVR